VQDMGVDCTLRPRAGQAAAHMQKFLNMLKGWRLYVMGGTCKVCCRQQAPVHTGNGSGELPAQRDDIHELEMATDGLLGRDRVTHATDVVWQHYAEGLYTQARAVFSQVTPLSALCFLIMLHACRRKRLVTQQWVC
jgi:hypothetical protein